jgi:hypothetical protein
VVVAFRAVKFWRVVDPTTRRSPAPLKVEVAVAPNAALKAFNVVDVAPPEKKNMEVVAD